MSPEAARLFFGCSISFLLGGIAGAFGLRTLYGDVDRVDPRPPMRAPVCPPTPCPACPEPVDCGELGRIPFGADPERETERGRSDYSGGIPDREPGPPGLPPSALRLAHRAVETEIASCLEVLLDAEPGSAVLSMTVTATRGTGFISDAAIGRATGGLAPVAGCLVDAARRARFEWSGSDGQLTFKLPVTSGQR